jgi:hypothetical protein
MQPFQVPVSAGCGHTFCQACVSDWTARQPTCPTCRTRTPAEEFRPISTRIVINQLERLLVRCKRCNQADIQRGNISEHEQQCPNQAVSCPAFDIKCTWKGTRYALTEHIQECPFRKIRPAIDDIYEHLKNIYEPLVDELNAVRQQLEKQIQRNNEQNRFLLAVFNKGKPMSDRCASQVWNCQLQQSTEMKLNMNLQMEEDELQRQMHLQKKKRISEMQGALDHKQMREIQRLNETFERPENQSRKGSPTNNQFYCANCQNRLHPNNISLHHCDGGCICRTCVEKYGSLN